MPKMKSHKGVQKRMKLTRKGKVTRRCANRSHLMSGMSGKRKRRLRRKQSVKTTGMLRTYRRLLAN